nr:YxlC family protein [uncultured Bacillus sp.]
MTNHRDPQENLISQLQKDWEQLDRLGSPSVPSKTALQDHLVMAKLEKRKAFYKELRLFIFIALLILTALITVVFNKPLIFIQIQILSLIAAPIIFLLLNKRKAREVPYHDR